MRTTLVIGGVASRAVGLERREGPTHDLRVAGVAVCAVEVDAVIARVVGRLMHEGQRRPEVSAVAVVALELGCEMTDRLARRRGPVVTTRAGAGRNVVVVEIDRQKRIGRMTNVALGRGLHVSGMLTDRRGAVVTAAATTEHLRVIDGRDRCKRNDRMAVLANVRGLHMRLRFTDRIHGIVTTHTVAGDIVMVEVGRRERHRRMAIFARVATGDMARTLARR